MSDGERERVPNFVLGGGRQLLGRPGPAPEGRSPRHAVSVAQELGGKDEAQFRQPYESASTRPLSVGEQVGGSGAVPAALVKFSPLSRVPDGRAKDVLADWSTASGPVKADLILIPNGIRTRVAALKARNSAFLEVFQDLLLLTETYCH